MHFWARVCANGEWREDHHPKRVCKALREGTGVSKKWILVLQAPLIPEVSFPNSSTHVLPGNYHLSGGEGRNVGVISSGLPRGRWTRYKGKVCISWFGGRLWILSNPGGTPSFKLDPGPNPVCLPLGSGPMSLQVEPPALLEAPSQ